MTKFSQIGFLTSLALLLAVSIATAESPTKSARWAKAMETFAAEDAKHPTDPGGVVFVGSSSIRLWDLPKSFPDLKPPALNRGFGGSQLEDSIRHLELLVLKHKPRLVFIYAGDNDIAAGKDAERVVKDFQTLTSRIHKTLPKARIAFIAIKPSLARLKLADTMVEANGQIAQLCAKREELEFIDVWKPMLGNDGQPRPELFRNDGLHLNDAGYKLWNSLVAPVLEPRLESTAQREREQ
ncbi:SGNH/GDSL hydrolase family protein [Adhaeretor mobilis]|uniref:GDSL-like Lipase/Acylhydrolase n=1 Tax=Adhaeretor mobilis TaxID=1930276 RepID=A0A517MT15_9BACT|nr:SGNH/GDSL hydrolase family protein [Adhaeretor mobilis]QDS98018.1 GDSL-like Lipase/Acylhydrolase [Adhaeretor mobilis]